MLSRASSKRARPRLGLLMRGVGYAYQDQVLGGAHEECMRQGVDLICFAGGDLGLGSADPANAIYDLVTSNTLDALLLASGTLNTAVGSAPLATLLERCSGIPVCSLSCEMPSVISLLIDNETSVTALTQHLVDVHGRRRIVFVAGQGPESDARMRGYSEGLASRGVPFHADLVHQGDYRGESGGDAVARYFRPGTPHPDAIVAANDWMALGAMQALAERGIRVPDEVSVIGFDDIDEARFLLPALTTVEQPARQLGTAGVRAVMARLRGQSSIDVQYLPTIEHIRRSCGCCGAAVQNSPETRAGVTANSTGFASIIQQHAPEVGEVLSPGWADELAAALVQDLREHTEHRFVRALERCLEASAHLGNVASWYATVTALRARAPNRQEGTNSSAEALARLCELGMIAIASQAERVQGNRRLQQEQQLRNLSQLSAALRTARDYEGLTRALQSHLGNLGIARGYIVAHSGPISETSNSTLLALCEQDSNAAAHAGTGFRSRDLYPEHLAPSRRSTMVLSPACFDDDLLGYCLLDFAGTHGSVFESVQEQVAVALKAIMLLDKVVEEATRRERAERERLEAEIGVARQIQTAVLPSDLVVEGLDVATWMLPATEVGGDYFDVLPFPGGAWLAIGDVTGHGLAAGLTMLMLQSMFAALTEAQRSASPDVVWSQLNKVLWANTHHRLRVDDYATLTLLKYARDGSFEYAGAHEDLLIVRASSREVTVVPTAGVWAGVRPEFPTGTVTTERLSLEPGDVLVLYTDGVIEAMNERREQYGMERLCDVLRAAATGNAQAIVEAVREAVSAWTSAPEDDMSLVVARRVPT